MCISPMSFIPCYDFLVVVVSLALGPEPDTHHPLVLVKTFKDANLINFWVDVVSGLSPPTGLKHDLAAIPRDYLIVTHIPALYHCIVSLFCSLLE